MWLLSGNVHSCLISLYILSICVSALDSFSILPVIAFFFQMLNCLYILSVHFRPLVIQPSLDWTLLVDYGLCDWVLYVLKMTITNGFLLNHKNGKHTTDSEYSIGILSDGLVEVIGNGNLEKVDWFLQSYTLSHTLHLVSIPSSFSYLLLESIIHWLGPNFCTS